MPARSDPSSGSWSLRSGAFGHESSYAVAVRQLAVDQPVREPTVAWKRIPPIVRTAACPPCTASWLFCAGGRPTLCVPPDPARWCDRSCRRSALHFGCYRVGLKARVIERRCRQPLGCREDARGLRRWWPRSFVGCDPAREYGAKKWSQPCACSSVALSGMSRCRSVSLLPGQETLRAHGLSRCRARSR